MSNSSNTTWVPRNGNFDTDGSLLKFNNCDVASDYAIDYYRPLDLTSKMLIDGLYEYWQGQHIRNISNMTRPEAMANYTVRQAVLKDFFQLNTTQQYDIDYSIWYFAKEHCESQYCGKLGWQGNGDLAGRGMLFNYFLEAVLVTVYAVILGASHMKRFSDHGRKPGIRKLIAPFRESSRTFLDAAMLFSFAMMAATLYLFAGNIITSREYVSGYTILTSIFMSTWSLLPAIILQNMTKLFLRRQRLRSWAWAVIFLLTLAVFIMYMLDWYDKLPDPREKTLDLDTTSRQFDFQDYCTNQRRTETFSYVCFAILGTVGAGLLIWVMLIRGLFRIPFLRGSRVLENAGKHWRTIVSVLSILSMWAWLGAFIYFRHTLSPDTPTNMDHSWSFGQVLALATFAPVFIEWGLVAIEGEVTGLTGLVSDRYEVVPSEKARDEADKGLAPGGSRYRGVPSDDEGAMELSYVR